MDEKHSSVNQKTNRTLITKVAAGVCVVIALALGLGLGLGLGLKKKNSLTLNIPYLKPPVQSATPSGFKTRRMLRDDVSRTLTPITSSDALNTIKSRLFSEGPGDFTYRLGMVDTRFQEIKKRTEESETPKVCLKTTPSKFEPSLPNDENFLMYLQCYEKLSDQLSVYFGQKDDVFYIAELQKSSGNTPTIAVLANVDSAGNKVDVWQIIVDDNQTPKKVAVTHIQADKTESTMHIVTAATSTGTGIGCGLKFSSTTSSLWFFGFPADDNSGGMTCPTTSDANYIASTVSGDWQDYCVDPVTFLSNSGACSSLNTNFPLTIFTFNELGTTSYANSAYDLIFNPDMPSGLVEFNKQE